ncbi:MAG TPA: hypothetical protein VFO08_11870 [Methylomirabilota bacterium]|jgi:hypothetical protein|nr:hypothetical protein [Methylomirabilota bacterium]
MREPGLGLSVWWDERDYRACGASLECRGRFIVGKLFDLDTRMLQAAWLAAFGRRLLGPPEIQAHDITRSQWGLILSHMGASPGEIADVQARMGRT